MRERVGDGAAAPGTGFLRIARRGERSVVSRAFAASPLKLLTPRNHGTAAWVYSATYGGGLVGRRCDPSGGGCRPGCDGAHLDAIVHQGVSIGSGHEHATRRARGERRSVGGRRLTRSCASPDRPIARRSTSTSRAPERSCSWTGCPPAGARIGERWAFDLYSSRTTVRVDGRSIFYDGLTLDRKDGDVAERMGRFDVLATVLIIGASLLSAADAAMTHVNAIPVVRRPKVLASASRLASEAAAQGSSCGSPARPSSR